MTEAQRNNYEKNKLKLKQIYKQVTGVKIFIGDVPIKNWMLLGFIILILSLIITLIWGFEVVLAIVFIGGFLFLYGDAQSGNGINCQ